MHSLQNIVDKNKAAARDAEIERSNLKRTEDNVVNDGEGDFVTFRATAHVIEVLSILWIYCNTLLYWYFEPRTGTLVLVLRKSRKIYCNILLHTSGEEKRREIVLNFRPDLVLSVLGSSPYRALVPLSNLPQAQQLAIETSGAESWKYSVPLWPLPGFDSWRTKKVNSR